MPPPKCKLRPYGTTGARAARNLLPGGLEVWAKWSSWLAQGDDAPLRAQHLGIHGPLLKKAFSQQEFAL